MRLRKHLSWKLFSVAVYIIVWLGFLVYKPRKKLLKQNRSKNGTVEPSKDSGWEKWVKTRHLLLDKWLKGTVLNFWKKMETNSWVRKYHIELKFHSSQCTCCWNCRIKLSVVFKKYIFSMLQMKGHPKLWKVLHYKLHKLNTGLLVKDRKRKGRR